MPLISNLKEKKNSKSKCVDSWGKPSVLRLFPSTPLPKWPPKILRPDIDSPLSSTLQIWLSVQRWDDSERSLESLRVLVRINILIQQHAEKNREYAEMSNVDLDMIVCFLWIPSKLCRWITLAGQSRYLTRKNLGNHLEEKFSDLE